MGVRGGVGGCGVEIVEQWRSGGDPFLPSFLPSHLAFKPFIALSRVPNLDPPPLKLLLVVPSNSHVIAPLVPPPTHLILFALLGGLREDCVSDEGSAV